MTTMKRPKTFKSLIFKDHIVGAKYFDGQAVMEFKNGYGISVIHGSFAYCGKGTYEVAVLKDGHICYDTHITDDVIGWQSPDQVTEIMKQIQEL